MADLPSSPLPFTSPTLDEARALRAAGDYLVRVGAQSSRLLLQDATVVTGNQADLSSSTSGGGIF